MTAGQTTVQLSEGGAWRQYFIDGRIRTVEADEGGLTIQVTSSPVILLPEDKVSQPNLGQLLISPNPLRQNTPLLVQFQDQETRKLTVELFNLAGVKVKSEQRLGSNQLLLSTRGLRKGAYLLWVVVEDKAGVLYRERRMILIL